MSFTDSRNRTWSVEFSVPVAKRIRTELSFDPLGEEGKDSGPMRFIERCSIDAEFLVASLFCACRGADGCPPKDPDEFAAGLVGDALGHACDQLLDAFAGFSPRPQVRTAYQRALKVMRERTATELEKRLTTMTEASLNDLISSALGSGTTSTSSPGSSASTPASSATANSS
jgi:hypothetical protein